MKSLLAVGEVSLALLVAVILSVVSFGILWFGHWALFEGVFPPPPPNFDEPAVGLLMAFLGTQAICFVLVGAVLVFLRVSPHPANRPRARPLVAAALGTAVGLVAVVFAWSMTTIMSLMGLDVEEQPWLTVLATENPGGLWTLAPWIVFVGPFSEEVFFRGYTFRFLTERGGLWLGVLLSSLMFALAHFHLPLLPVYFMYGVLFAWLYERTGRLLTPVFAHVTVNLVGISLLLWSVSGAPSAG